MATAKKTTAKAETKTAAKKTATKKAETAAKAETKAAAPKAAAKTETKAAAPKAAAKKPAAKKAEPKFDLYIQFAGATVSVADIEKNVKKVVKGAKSYRVYVKPDESKAYIVAKGETTGEITGDMDVFFVAD